MYFFLQWMFYRPLPHLKGHPGTFQVHGKMTFPRNRLKIESLGLVRKGGFEPPRSCERQPLKRARSEARRIPVRFSGPSCSSRDLQDPPGPARRQLRCTTVAQRRRGSARACVLGPVAHEFARQSRGHRAGAGRPRLVRDRNRTGTTGSSLGCVQRLRNIPGRQEARPKRTRLPFQPDAVRPRQSPASRSEKDPRP